MTNLRPFKALNCAQSLSCSFKALKSLALLGAFLALSAALAPLCAQSYRGFFNLYQEKSMSSNAVVLTLQQPASGSRLIELLASVIECSSATTMTLEVGCDTPATVTAQTPTAIGYPRFAPLIEGYVNSDAASCTVIAYASVPANTPVPFSLSGIWLSGGDGAGDLTLRSGTVASGTCRAWIVGREY